jgi:hypothetical protein
MKRLNECLAQHLIFNHQISSVECEGDRACSTTECELRVELTSDRPTGSLKPASSNEVKLICFA